MLPIGTMFNVKPCRLSKPCRRECKLRLTNGPQRLSYRSTFQDHVLEHGPRAGSALRDHAARAKRHLWVSLRVVWIGGSLDSWTLPTAACVACINVWLRPMAKGGLGQ